MILDVLLCLGVGLTALSMIVTKSRFISIFGLFITSLLMSGVFYRLGSHHLVLVLVLITSSTIPVLYLFSLILPHPERKSRLVSNNHRVLLAGVAITPILLGILALALDYNAEILGARPIGYIFSISGTAHEGAPLFTEGRVALELVAIFFFSMVVSVVHIAKMGKVK